MMQDTAENEGMNKTFLQKATMIRSRRRNNVFEHAAAKSRTLMAVVVLFLTTTALTQVTGATEISLEPLEEIVWSVQGRIDDTSRTPLALALSAQGKRIDVDYTEVAINIAPVYANPVEACVAVIRAGVELNESWWGDLCAPWDERGNDGIPLGSYTPNSGENMYSAFTYHSVNASFPRTTGATLKTYLRVGGLHIFDIAWTQVAGEITSTGIRFVLAFQEGPSGGYRFAPEALTPFDPIKDLLANTEAESTTLTAFRTEIPSRAHSFSVYGLYDGAPDSFPLTCHFRGGVAENSPYFEGLNAFRAAYSAAVGMVPKAPEDFSGSQARTDLAGLLAGDGYQALDETDYIGRVFNPFRREFAFLIENPDYVLAYNLDQDTSTVNAGFLTLYLDGSNWKWAGYQISTELDRFLTHPQIWPRMKEVIDAVLSAE